MLSLPTVQQTSAPHQIITSQNKVAPAQIVKPKISDNRVRPNQIEYHSVHAKGPMLDRVYSMRYRSYSAEDYIDETASEKFMDEYDAMPNCKSFLTYAGKKPIGSIRACIYNPEKGNSIPVMDVFEKELRESIGFDDVMVEANKFVIDPSFQKKGGVRARLSIYRNIAEVLVQEDAKYLVAGIRTEHIKFYKMLNFEVMSDIKEYPHLNFKTVLVVCKNVKASCDFVFNKTNAITNPVETGNDALLSNGYH